MVVTHNEMKKSDKWIRHLVIEARIPEPTITRNNPNTFINVMESPIKNPIIAAIAMLPPMIIGPTMEIASPEP